MDKINNGKYTKCFSRIKSYIGSDFLFCLGLLIILVLGIVYVVLGDSIVVNPHDQLDGEIFTYILHAKHLNESIYYELMNGLPSTGMQMAAPAMIVLYLIFSPVMAYSISTAFIMITAYVGMFALLRSFFVRSWIAAIAAFAFALLPFYAVYGLSIMGIPFLLWFVRRLWVNESLSYGVHLIIACIFFSLFSSLVLSGFAIIGVLFVVFGYAVFFRREKKCFIKFLAFAEIALIVGYLFTNYDLLIQTLLGSGFVSHKSEYVINSNQFSLLGTVEFLLRGQQHAVSNQLLIVLVVFIGQIISIYVLCKEANYNDILRSLAIAITVVFLTAIFIALFYELFHSGKGVVLRELLPGSLKAFQFDRLYWLYPTIWYVLLGLCFELMARLTIKTRKIKRALVIIMCVIVSLTLGKSLSSNAITLSLVNQINSELTIVQNQLTWKEFFGESLFDKIKQSIIEKDGKNLDEIKVVSIGLYPSIALYNGFQCLDGYSNNYPLEYKHQFREVIEGELEKSPDLYNYFVGWGNRCYVFSHEIGRNYFINKNSGLTITDLSISLSSLKALGCDYIFSAVLIESSNEYGLDFMGSFIVNDVPYNVNVYRVL